MIIIIIDIIMKDVFIIHRIVNNILLETDYCIIKWKQFFVEKKEYDLHIKIRRKLVEQHGVEMFTVQPGPMVLKSQKALLSGNIDWTEACITLLDGKEDGLEGALIAAIMTHLSTRSGLMLHSSLVDFDGKGIMFVGPSGIGKTTQAELWMKYRDAVIINGDMALIREEEDGFTGYGCPWHGSSPYCENRQVPLCGIIVLEQAKENRIERLSGVTLIERMMNNIFLPHWYPRGVEAAMETVDHLLSKVPVYLMKCRPDEEAVEMAEGVLFTRDD